MAIARPVRFLGALSVVLVFFLIYQLWQPSPKIDVPKHQGEKILSYDKDPLLDLVGEPEEPLWRHTEHDYSPDNPNSPRVNATLLSLVRNKELNDLIRSMRDLERTWNSKYNYPWSFFNDEPFTEEFKTRTQAETKAKCYYHEIPKEHWEQPSWINEELWKESVSILQEHDVQYASMKSYHQMCRWNSGMFYHHPALLNTKWYWRVEPNVKFFCDVDYDVFRWMQDHNKTYGFNINLYDSPDTLPSLWPETIKFLAAHPEHLHKNNAMAWLTDSERRPEHNLKAHGYSTCHFWSNFEIANMEFWRSQAYEDYFAHLDRAGGFFYERWGDAPVHSIALGLFEDQSKIHWCVSSFHAYGQSKILTRSYRFKDIGYNHIPFFNCPNSPKCRGCEPGKMYGGESWLQNEDCRPNWFKYVGTG